jgi:hypothetical protein
MGTVDPNCERTLRSLDVHVYDVSRPESVVHSAGSILRAIQEIGVSTLFLTGLDCKVRLLLAKVLPPERITLYDPDSTNSLFQKMALDRGFQRRIAFDESDYYRRISPWPYPPACCAGSTSKGAALAVAAGNSSARKLRFTWS